MSKPHTGVAFEVHVDGGRGDAVHSAYRWLVEDPALGGTGVRVDLAADPVARTMAPADWLQVTADALSVIHLVVGSLVAWRRSRASAPTVRLRWRDRDVEFVVDEETLRRVLDALDGAGGEPADG